MHNVLTEEVNKIALSANDDKIIQFTDLVSPKREIKWTI